MKLFKYEGYKIVVEPEAIMLKPFKAIWDRDKSKEKEIAMQELAFIYFMEDPRSDYMVYMDKNRRCSAIKDGEGIPDKWEPDKVVKDAMEFYAGFKSDAALLLDDIKKQVAKIRQLSSSINIENINDVNDKLQALDKLTAITAKIPKLTVEIMETEKKMNEEIQNMDKVRGTTEKSMFEDE